MGVVWFRSSKSWVAKLGPRQRTKLKANTNTPCRPRVSFKSCNVSISCIAFDLESAQRDSEGRYFGNRCGQSALPGAGRLVSSPFLPRSAGFPHIFPGSARLPKTSGGQRGRACAQRWQSSSEQGPPLPASPARRPGR